MAARLLFLLLYLTVKASGSLESPIISLPSPPRSVSLPILNPASNNTPVMSCLIDALYKSLKSSNAVSFNFDTIVASDHLTSNDYILANNVQGTSLAGPADSLVAKKPFDTITKVLAAPESVQPTSKISEDCNLFANADKLVKSNSLKASITSPSACEYSSSNKCPETMLNELISSKLKDSANVIFSSEPKSDLVVASNTNTLSASHGSNTHDSFSPLLCLLASFTNGRTESDVNSPCLSPESLTISSFDDFLIPCCPSIDTTFCVPDYLSSSSLNNGVSFSFPFLNSLTSLIPPSRFQPILSSKSEINSAPSIEKSNTLDIASLVSQNDITLISDHLNLENFKTGKFSVPISSNCPTELPCHIPPYCYEGIQKIDRDIPEHNYLPEIDLNPINIKQHQPCDRFDVPTEVVNDNFIKTLNGISPESVPEYFHYKPSIDILSSPTFLLPTPELQADIYRPLKGLLTPKINEFDTSNNDFSIHEPVNNLHKFQPTVSNLNDCIVDITPIDCQIPLTGLSEFDFLLPSLSVNGHSPKKFSDKTGPSTCENVSTNYFEHSPIPVLPIDSIIPTVFQTKTKSISTPFSANLDVIFLPNTPNPRQVPPLPYVRESSPFIAPVLSSLNPPRVLPLFQSSVDPSPIDILHRLTEQLAPSVNRNGNDISCNTPITIFDQLSSQRKFDLPDITITPNSLKIFDLSRFIPKTINFTDISSINGDVKLNSDTNNLNISDSCSKDSAFSLKFKNAKENINKLKYFEVSRPKGLNNDVKDRPKPHNELDVNDISELQALRSCINDDNSDFAPAASVSMPTECSVSTNTLPDNSLKNYIDDIKTYLSFREHLQSTSVGSENETHTISVIPDAVESVTATVDVSMNCASNDKKATPKLDRVTSSSSPIVVKNTEIKLPSKNPIVTTPRVLSPVSVPSLPIISQKISYYNYSPMDILNLFKNPLLPYVSSVTVGFLPKDELESDPSSDCICKMPVVDQISKLDDGLLDGITDIDELLKLIILADLLNDDEVDTELMDDIIRVLYDSKNL